MIKCFLLSIGILLCTEQNVDVKCVDENLDFLLAVGTRTPAALNLAVAECLIDASGCCSWRGGVLTYSQDDRSITCHDGTQSPTCRYKQ